MTVFSLLREKNDFHVSFERVIQFDQHCGMDI